MPNSKNHLSVSKIGIVFSVAFIAMILVTTGWTLSRKGSLDAPPAPWNVDGVFYDNIAFNLGQSEGFVVNLKNESWRKVYTDANQQPGAQGDYDWLMSVKGTGPTALRSPGYPIALAAVFRVFGHRYSVARTVGCVFVSFGLASLLTFCAARWGILPAVIAAATLTVDFSVMQSAGTLASESLAIAIFASTFLLLVNAWESPSHRNWLLAGASFAALLLTRGIWSLGLLILVALSAVFLIPAVRKRMSVAHFATFLVTTILIAMPWWIRNCQVTQHFTPFGTAGSCGFVGAYCDESLANFGQWQADVFNENQREVQASVDMDTVHLAQLEYKIGQASLRKTKGWCLANWNRIPELMTYRALSHWGLFNPTVPTIAMAANLWLVIVGLIGCICCTGELRRVFVFVLLLDSLIVMLTWEHLGRYAIPIRPLVHIGYGLAIASIIQKLWALFPRAANGRTRRT